VESEALEAEEVLDGIICSSDHLVFKCALKVVMAGKNLVTEDRSSRQLVSCC